jgi:hypothetical protein
MAVTPFNIVQGPAVITAASYGTSIPTDASMLTSPAASFTDLGGTTGGITLEIDETIGDIKVDQIMDPVGGRITARTIQVTTTLMENTLSNFLLALNNAATVSTGTATGGQNYSKLVPTTTTSAVQPLFTSLIIDGWGPTLATGQPAVQRMVLPKVLSQPKISQKFDMANQANVAVTFTAYYISPSIPPFYILVQQS